MMQSVSATETINVGLSTVWPLISDVTQIAHWHPSIASVDLLTAKPTGLHAARRCHFKDGTSVREEVVDLSEAKTIRFRLSEFSVPMKRLELQIETSATSIRATSVTFSLHYEVKFGLLGRLLGATVMRRELSKMAARIVAGLAGYAERTGQKPATQVA
jgi:ribosome-associated toxin RatA of RatAB toxin-antitoxin module